MHLVESECGRFAALRRVSIPEAVRLIGPGKMLKMFVDFNNDALYNQGKTGEDIFPWRRHEGELIKLVNREMEEKEWAFSSGDLERILLYRWTIRDSIYRRS